MSIGSYPANTNPQKCYPWARVSTFNAHEGPNNTLGTFATLGPEENVAPQEENEAIFNSPALGYNGRGQWSVWGGCSSTGDTEARVHKLRNIAGTRPNHLCAVT